MYSTRATPNQKPQVYRCKVCFDFGKGEKEYNSHSTKNHRGEVTCPLLLKTECKYCLKKGHMAKYCKKREDDEKKQKTITPSVTKMKIQPIQVQTPKINKKADNHFNSYNLLMDDDEDQEQEDQPQEIKAPEIIPPAPHVPAPALNSRFRKVIIDKETGKRVVYVLNWTSSAYESDSECDDYNNDDMWIPLNF